MYFSYWYMYNKINCDLSHFGLIEATSAAYFEVFTKIKLETRLQPGCSLVVIKLLTNIVVCSLKISNHREDMYK